MNQSREQRAPEWDGGDQERLLTAFAAVLGRYHYSWKTA
jgi:hypothetical protein